MAVPATTVWEVRPTVGSDNNGGGFVPGSSGTDWSQQTSPQYALTGIASSGSGNTVLSTLAAADMVGNIAQVTSGTNFNKGMFEVTSVSVGVSITFGTNIGGSSICSGVGASGVINIGGALATLAILYRVINSATQMIASNTIYIKATGSLTLTAVIQNFDVNYFTVIGYTSTRGDNGRATITTSTNSINLYELGNSGYTSFWYNIAFTNTAGTPGDAYYFNSNNTQVVIFQNCLFNGFAIAINFSTYLAYHVLFVACEITGCTTAGVSCEFPQYMEFDDCYIHGNAIGVSVNPNGNSTYGANVLFNRTVIYNNTTYGVIGYPGASGQSGIGLVFSFWNCAIVSNGSDGVNTVGNNSVGQGVWTFNTIYYNNTGYGINCGSAGDSGGADHPLLELIMLFILMVVGIGIIFQFFRVI